MADLKQPVETYPQDVVENVFPMPAAPGAMADAEPMVRDWTSVFEMETFLHDRLRRDQQPTPGGVLTVPVGVDVTESVIPRVEEWNHWLSDDGRDARQHWKRAGAIMLAFNVAMNLLNGNAVSVVDDGIEAAQSVKDVVEDHFGIGDITTVHRVPHREERTVEKVEHETLTFNSSGEAQPVGEAVVDQEIIDKVLDSIEARQKAGSSLENPKFTGVSSDDWRRDPDRNGFGHVNSGADGKSDNARIAQERLERTKPELLRQAAERGIDLSEATFEFKEAVLEEEDVLAVENAIMANGFDTYPTVDEAVDAALEIYNSDPASLPEELRDVLHDRLPRGFRADLSYRTVKRVPGEDKITYTREKVTEHDGEPENENNDYDLPFVPLLLPPVPKRWGRKVKETVRTEDIIVPPTMPKPEYLKLYPQARTEMGTLTNHAWAYSRKYQHLMRETDRIQGLYRLGYEDADGNPRRLRAMFVDHEPTPDMLGRVAEMLQTISQMQGGRVGHELDMIAIYPSENAGPGHRNSKKVALGQDIQFERDTLGLAYASLGLVEVHMPPETSEDNLGEYMSPDWVLAHEIAGHFTDLNEEQNILTPLGVTLQNGAEIYVTNDRHTDAMQQSYDRAVAHERSGQPTRWRVHRRVENANGELVDMVHDTASPTRTPSRFRVVNAVRRAARAMRSDDFGNGIVTGDPRFAEAMYVTKETGHVTEYGGTNRAERYAESAAAKMVGDIPFDQAHDGAGIVTRPGFAQGYRIASYDDQLLAGRWGSDPSQRGAVFTDQDGNPVRRPDWQHSYGRPEEDMAVAALMNQARRTPMPAEQDLLHILTGTRATDDK